MPEESRRWRVVIFPLDPHARAVSPPWPDLQAELKPDTASRQSLLELMGYRVLDWGRNGCVIVPDRSWWYCLPSGDTRNPPGVFWVLLAPGEQLHRWEDE